MATRTHWEKIYKAKPPEAVSWYRPHLETSLALIERAARTIRHPSLTLAAGNPPSLMTSLHADTKTSLSLIFRKPLSM